MEASKHALRSGATAANTEPAAGPRGREAETNKTISLNMDVCLKRRVWPNNALFTWRVRRGGGGGSCSSETMRPSEGLGSDRKQSHAVRLVRGGDGNYAVVGCLQLWQGFNWWWRRFISWRPVLQPRSDLMRAFVWGAPRVSWRSE